MDETFLVLERSSQNLKKIDEDKKVVLEGVFAEFGVENRNGRIYTEREYLPHLEYLNTDIKNGNLLGELDHPERFEVALQNVSHRITKLWYDTNKRQVLGRIEILENTPKGKIAKSLLDAGVPLSISSRAAGVVNDDKTVSIQQIYTYDLVAKPGFEAAQLHTVNESAYAKINEHIISLNNEHDLFEKYNISKNLGIINENVSIIPMNSIGENEVIIRPEAQNIYNKNKDTVMNEQEILNKINELNNKISAYDTVMEGIKSYINELKQIQEDSLDWQSQIAKTVNKINDKFESVKNATDKKINKITEATNQNATIINGMQSWTEQISETLNATANAVDNNANMLNGVNEWVENISKQTNNTISYIEDQLGIAVSKSEVKTIVEWVELELESKKNPSLKKKLDEMLQSKNIEDTSKIFEANIKGIQTLDNAKPIPVKNETINKPKNSVTFDAKSKTILAPEKKSSPLKASTSLPKGVKTLTAKGDTISLTNSAKVKGIKTLDTTKTIPVSKPEDKKGVGSYQKQQNLKLNTSKEGSKLKESKISEVSNDIKEKRNKINEQLELIQKSLEKKRTIHESIINCYPFTSLLSESDREKFNNLSAVDKEKIAENINKSATSDPQIIQRIWEQSLATENNVSEPLWLSAAPKQYRELFDKSSDTVKESIKAKSDFFMLETQYQIDNFWENTGLTNKKSSIINENLITNSINPIYTVTDEIDSLISQVGKEMGKYNK